MWLVFPFYASALVTAPCSRLQMTTSTTIGQSFDRWMLTVKTQQAEICLSKTETFCHFTFLTLHVFLLPLGKEIHLLMKIPLNCCVLFIWVLAKQNVATVVSSMAVFVRTFMHAITAEWRKKLKALNWLELCDMYNVFYRLLSTSQFRKLVYYLRINATES